MSGQNASHAVMAQRKMKDEPHAPPTREKVLAPVRHWTIRRKWGVLRAVEAGVVSGEEVMAAHNISAQEFATWALASNIMGTDALKAIGTAISARRDLVELLLFIAAEIETLKVEGGDSRGID